MKTTLLSLKAFFTICLLCLVGGVNVMAQETYSYTFKEGDIPTTTTPKTYTFNKVKWNVSGTLANAGWDKNNTPSKGIQLATGTKGKNATNVTFETSDIPGTITSVKVNASTNSKGSANITVKVGSKDFGKKQQCDKDAKDYTFTGEGTGTISINLDNTASKKGLYIQSITIEYTTGKVTPTPTITPASKTFSESFKATISCTDAAAKIYYTLDGKEPNEKSELYTEPGVTIPEATTTLKAVAIKDGKASKVADAVYTYVAPVAPTYTYTIWSEDWSSFLETEEEQPHSGTNATYKYGDETTETTDTKLYFGELDKYAGGEVPELLIKPNQSFFINVTSLKGCSGTLHFSFITNKESFTIESATTDVKVGAPTIEGDKYTYAITVPKGTEGLNLKIKNTGKNMRVDNLSLSAKLKDLGTGSFTITPARYGTYYTEDAFIMPEGVTGYTITDKDGESLTLNAAYPANEVVPAKTALLLKATEKPATNQEFTYTIVNSDKVAPEGNLLHGSVEATKTQVEGATAYYKLAKGEEGIGFYWANENGTAFTNGANKAYLAITGKLSQMRGFSFESMTTGINNVVANTNNSKNAVIYDINGRRVNSLNAAKGVYIVNGKKVIVK